MERLKNAFREFTFVFLTDNSVLPKLCRRFNGELVAYAHFSTTYKLQFDLFTVYLDENLWIICQILSGVYNFSASWRLNHVELKVN